jgi:hypothetical protein
MDWTKLVPEALLAVLKVESGKVSLMKWGISDAVTKSDIIIIYLIKNE